MSEKTSIARDTCYLKSKIENFKYCLIMSYMSVALFVIYTVRFYYRFNKYFSSLILCHSLIYAWDMLALHRTVLFGICGQGLHINWC